VFESGAVELGMMREPVVGSKRSRTPEAGQAVVVGNRFKRSVMVWKVISVHVVYVRFWATIRVHRD
jgi:hypothetical protein